MRGALWAAERPNMESAILSKLNRIEDLLAALLRERGDRLTRAQMCERLQICSKTLTSRLRRGDMPFPGKDGKWLLHEIVAWESDRHV